MRYIIIIILTFSFPMIFSGSSTAKDTNNSAVGSQEKILKKTNIDNQKAKQLEQKIQKKIKKDVCDPEKILHLGPFN